MTTLHRRGLLAGGLALGAAPMAWATSLAPFVQATYALRPEAHAAASPDAVARAGFVADLAAALSPIAPRVVVRAGQGAQISIRGEDETQLVVAQALIEQIRPFALRAAAGGPILARTEAMARFTQTPKSMDVRVLLTPQGKAALAAEAPAGRTLTLLHGGEPIGSGWVQQEQAGPSLQIAAPQVRADLGRWNFLLTLARHGLRAQLVGLIRYPEP